jgi:hypothetical protein
MVKPPPPGFREEAEKAFRFLVDEFGYDQPTYDKDPLLEKLGHVGPILSYEVRFGWLDRMIIVVVTKERPEGGSPYHASMRVVAARAGREAPEVRVRTKQHLVQELGRLAGLVRAFHAVRQTPEGDELLQSPA